MASEIALKDFRRWFEKQGVLVEHGAKHLIFSRTIAGVHYSYTVPTISGRHDKYFYLAKTRKALKLTAKDGFADTLFN